MIEVKCPRCGHIQPDNGKNTSCRKCEYIPMPFHNELGILFGG